MRGAALNTALQILLWQILSPSYDEQVQHSNQRFKALKGLIVGGIKVVETSFLFPFAEKDKQDPFH